jgi:Zinc knuckle
MATAQFSMDELDSEIERLQNSVRSISRDLRVDSYGNRNRHSLSASVTEAPPRLQPFEESSESEVIERPRRREIEARRFNGKEPVNEYLVQFELTAKRNKWSESDRVTSLLCALDGSARSILSEIDDVESATFADVKQLLLKRFGPVRLTDVHEQALDDLKLYKGQTIRELSSEVLRLAKLAYPDFDANARNRIAVRTLINAIPDKDAVFYIKDKNPGSVDDVCTLYERYKVLSGEDHHRNRTAIRSLKSATDDESAAVNAQVTAAVEKMTEVTGVQLGKLTAAIAQLTAAATAPPPAVNTLPAAYAAPGQHPHPHPPQGRKPIDASRSASQQPPAATLSAAAPPFRPNEGHKASGAPRTPCPRCSQIGHWARDCPMPQSHTDACFLCGQPGHRRRDCPVNAQGNGHRSALAPNAWPSARQ